jgi:hypothetical protein
MFTRRRGTEEQAAHADDRGLWIDVDGDGECDDHDVGMIRPLYGWDRTIDTQVGPGTRDEASMSGKLLSLSELGTTWLCSRFFPSAR